MKTFFIERMKSLLIWQAVLFVVSDLLCRLLSSEPSEMFIMSAIYIGFFPMIFSKTNWFLTLPFSRRKLLLFHFLEGLITNLFSATLVLIIFMTFKDVSFQNAVKPVLCFAAALSIFYFVAAFRFMPSAQSFSLRNVQFNTLKWNAIAFGGLIALFTTYMEVWLWVALGFMIIAYFLALPFKRMVMPSRSLQTVRRGLRLGLAGLYAGIFVSSAILILKGDPSLGRTSYSMDFFGSLPVRLPETRALELFASPMISSSRVLTRSLGKKPLFHGNDPIWTSRTEHCTDSSCLDLSDDYLIRDGNAEVRFADFENLMKLCKFELNSHHEIRCSGPKLSSSKLNGWLKDLQSSKYALVWLRSADPTLQIVAMKSLRSKELLTEERSQVEHLQASSDPIVRAIASEELDRFLPFLKTKIGQSSSDSSPLF